MNKKNSMESFTGIRIIIKSSFLSTVLEKVFESNKTLLNSFHYHLQFIDIMNKQNDIDNNFHPFNILMILRINLIKKSH